MKNQHINLSTKNNINSNENLDNNETTTEQINLHSKTKETKEIKEMSPQSLAKNNQGELIPIKTNKSKLTISKSPINPEAGTLNNITETDRETEPYINNENNNNKNKYVSANLKVANYLDPHYRINLNKTTEIFDNANDEESERRSKHRLKSQNIPSSTKNKINTTEKKKEKLLSNTNVINYNNNNMFSVIFSNPEDGTNEKLNNYETKSITPNEKDGQTPKKLKSEKNLNLENFEIKDFIPLHKKTQKLFKQNNPNYLNKSNFRTTQLNEHAAIVADSLLACKNKYVENRSQENEKITNTRFKLIHGDGFLKDYENKKLELLNKITVSNKLVVGGTEFLNNTKMENLSNSNNANLSHTILSGEALSHLGGANATPFSVKANVDLGSKTISQLEMGKLGTSNHGKIIEEEDIKGESPRKSFTNICKKKVKEKIFRENNINDDFNEGTKEYFNPSESEGTVDISNEWFIKDIKDLKVLKDHSSKSKPGARLVQETNREQKSPTTSKILNLGSKLKSQQNLTKIISQSSSASDSGNKFEKIARVQNMEIETNINQSDKILASKLKIQNSSSKNQNTNKLNSSNNINNNSRQQSPFSRNTQIMKKNPNVLTSPPKRKYSKPNSPLERKKTQNNQASKLNLNSQLIQLNQLNQNQNQNQAAQDQKSKSISPNNLQNSQKSPNIRDIPANLLPNLANPTGSLLSSSSSEEEEFEEADAGPSKKISKNDRHLDTEVDSHLKKEFNKYGVFYPDCVFKIIWDIVAFVFVVYQALAVPYKICFDVIFQGKLGIFEVLQDFFFMVDILLNFNTGYFENLSIVMSRRKIALNYLKFWFWLDLVSSFPYTLVVSASVYFDFSSTESVGGVTVDGLDTIALSGKHLKNTTYILKILKVLRLLRFIRLLRVAKIRKLLKKFEELLSSFFLFNVSILKLLILVLFISHWGACIWYLIGATNHENGDDTWLVHPNFVLVDASDYDKYIASLYFFTTTMTTVGYGDITALAFNEKIYSSFIMIFASCFYAFFIGTITSVLINSSDKENFYNNKLSTVMRYLEEHHVSEKLQLKVRTYLEYIIDSRKRNLIYERDVLDLLSPDLNFEVRCSFNLIYLKAIDVISENSAFAALLAMRITDEQVNPFEVLFTKNEPSTCMYFINKGVVQIFDEKIVFKKLIKGEFFGEIGLFTQDCRQAGAESVHFSILLVLTRGVLSEVLTVLADEDLGLWRNIVDELREYRRLLLLREHEKCRCYSCGMNGHLVRKCPQLDYSKIEIRNLGGRRSKESEKIEVFREYMKKVKRCRERKLRVKEVKVYVDEANRQGSANVGLGGGVDVRKRDSDDNVHGKNNYVNDIKNPVDNFNNENMNAGNDNNEEKERNDFASQARKRLKTRGNSSEIFLTNEKKESSQMINPYLPISVKSSQSSERKKLSDNNKLKTCRNNNNTAIKRLFMGGEKLDQSNKELLSTKNTKAKHPFISAEDDKKSKDNNNLLEKNDIKLNMESYLSSLDNTREYQDFPCYIFSEQSLMKQQNKKGTIICDKLEQSNIDMNIDNLESWKDIELNVNNENKKSKENKESKINKENEANKKNKKNNENKENNENIQNSQNPDLSSNLRLKNIRSSLTYNIENRNISKICINNNIKNNNANDSNKILSDATPTFPQQINKQQVIEDSERKCLLNQQLLNSAENDKSVNNEKNTPNIQTKAPDISAKIQILKTPSPIKSNNRNNSSNSINIENTNKKPSSALAKQESSCSESKTAKQNTPSKAIPTKIMTELEPGEKLSTNLHILNEPTEYYKPDLQKEGEKEPPKNYAFQSNQQLGKQSNVAHVKNKNSIDKLDNLDFLNSVNTLNDLNQSNELNELDATKSFKSISQFDNNLKFDHFQKEKDLVTSDKDNVNVDYVGVETVYYKEGEVSGIVKSLYQDKHEDKKSKENFGGNEENNESVDTKRFGG